MVTNILAKISGHVDNQFYKLVISFSSSMQYDFLPFSILIRAKTKFAREC